MPILPLHDQNPRVLIAWPRVTWSLIGACVAVFFYQISVDPHLHEHMVLGLGVIPAVFAGNEELPAHLYLVPASLTLVTSLFLHGDIWHLAGNMLFLWIFGDNIEDSMGHVKFLIFYFICGVAAGLAQVVVEPGSIAPTIGASGAISGVLGAYLILHPRARILTLFFVLPIRVPAYILLVAWIGLQAFSASVEGASGGGIAWWAHIGGFIAGMALIAPFRHKAIPLFDGREPPRGLRMVRPPKTPRAERKDPADRSDDGPWS